MKVAIAWPNMWLSGRRFRKRMGAKGVAHFRYFITSRSTGTMFARTFRWVMTTPFGSAVAPDVKMISATSSRPMTRLRSLRHQPLLARVPLQIVEPPDRRVDARKRRHVLSDHDQPG